MTTPSSNARAGVLIVLLTAVVTYGLIRAFSFRAVYLRVLSAPKEAVA